MSIEFQRPTDRPVACSDGLSAVVLEHWTRGGTGITNFPKQERERYQKAIDLNGDEDLVIAAVPHAGLSGHYSDSEWMLETMCSLHCLNGMKDLSAFWRIFESLKADNNKISGD